MIEHVFNIASSRVIALIGYIASVALLVLSFFLIINDFENWHNHIHLPLLSLGVFYLSDLTIASREKTTILFKILKQQDDRRILDAFKPLPSDLDFQSPIKYQTIASKDVDGNFKFEGDVPKEVSDILRNLAEELKKASQQGEKENYDKMSVEELEIKMKKAQEEEDYETAAFFRELINKRKGES